MKVEIKNINYVDEGVFKERKTVIKTSTLVIKASYLAADCVCVCVWRMFVSLPC